MSDNDKTARGDAPEERKPESDPAETTAADPASETPDDSAPQAEPAAARPAPDTPTEPPAPEPAPQTAEEAAAAESGAPWHLWLIGIVSLLWNAVGAFDYTATQMRLEFYMSQFTAAQLDYFYGFPAWVDGAWAIAVWGAVLGSLALLLRMGLAVWLFGLSVLGMIATGVYNFGLSNGLEIMGGAGPLAFTVVVWVVAFFLFFYARAMKRAGALK